MKSFQVQAAIEFNDDDILLSAPLNKMATNKPDTPGMATASTMKYGNNWFELDMSPFMRGSQPNWV